MTRQNVAKIFILAPDNCFRRTCPTIRFCRCATRYNQTALILINMIKIGTSASMTATKVADGARLNARCEVIVAISDKPSEIANHMKFFFAKSTISPNLTKARERYLTSKIIKAPSEALRQNTKKTLKKFPPT